jgi:hypothetical protein
VYVLSPYAQLMVIRARHDGPIRTPLEWPLDQNEWAVEWVSPNEPAGEQVQDAKLAWQGDGNLVGGLVPLFFLGTEVELCDNRQVIYASGGVPWASATHGRNPQATMLRWGLGTPEEPYLEIVDDEGARVWST